MRDLKKILRVVLGICVLVLLITLATRCDLKKTGSDIGAIVTTSEDTPETTDSAAVTEIAENDMASGNAPFVEEDAAEEEHVSEQTEATAEPAAELPDPVTADTPESAAAAGDQTAAEETPEVPDVSEEDSTEGSAGSKAETAGGTDPALTDKISDEEAGPEASPEEPAVMSETAGIPAASEGSAEVPNISETPASEEEKANSPAAVAVTNESAGIAAASETGTEAAGTADTSQGADDTPDTPEASAAGVDSGEIPDMAAPKDSTDTREAEDAENSQPVHRDEAYEEMSFVTPTQQGSIVKAYGENGESFAIYLPYGYSESRKYNVLLFLNGKDGDPYKIVGDDIGYGHENTVLGSSYTNKEYLDFLIQNGYCEPVIVVSTENTLAIDKLDRYERLLKYTAEHFSTYAEGTSTEDLIAARDHFAIAGLSTGSQSVCLCAQYLPDFFGTYGFFSGLRDYDETLEALSTKDTIRYLVINSGGWRDEMYDYMLKGYNGFSALPNVQATAYVVVPSAGHEWTAFDAGIRELLMHFAPAE